MTIKTMLLATVAAALPLALSAQDAPDLPDCENCVDEMTIVSWGGAYQESQQKAYTEPYTRPQASP